MVADVLPPEIRNCMRDFVARRRRFALLSSSGWALAFGLGWMLLACLVDRVLVLPVAARLAALTVGAAGLIIILARPLQRHLRSRVDWVKATAELEAVHPPFAQGLRTVVSQWLERSEYRGSPLMLAQLLKDVTREVERSQPRRWVSYRMAALPWCAVAALSVAVAALRTVPVLDLPTLTQRLMLPLAPIPPVTTTRISVRREPPDPGVRGQPLSIRARVQRMSGSSVDIHTSHGQSGWTRIPMLQAGSGEYVFTLPALERDLHYYVTAGDATTPVYTATVLRPPAIAEYRVHYRYPDYTGRGALTLVNTDGIIEALVGTSVTVALVATEPLGSAALLIDGQTLDMEGTEDAHVVRAGLVVTSNQKIDAEITSAGGLTTMLPAALTIRAQLDREPLVRLIEPSEDLRLHPRHLVPLQYQAMDDYGIADLFFTVQVNSSPLRNLLVPRQGDARRQEGQFVLDLATLDVRVGDVVALSLVASDGAHKQIQSPPRHILISPRSVDISTHRRIAELRQAAQLAMAMRQELESAREAMQRLLKGRASEADELSNRLDASNSLAGAVEAGLLFHQSLLRACAKSASAEQSLALAESADRTRVEISRVEHLLALDAGATAPDMLLEQLTAALEAARTLSAEITTFSDGENAAAILADRVNIRTPPASPPADEAAADRLKETVRRARQEIAAAVEELGLNPRSSTLDAALKRKVAAAESWTRSRREVDFEAPAVEWAAALLRQEAPVRPLSERLASASAVEAVRPDSDPIRARDLQLASRAAARLTQRSLIPHDALEEGEWSPPREALEEFPTAVAALQREHRLNRRPTDVHPPEEVRAMHDAADAARTKLAQWASQRLGLFSAARDTDSMDAEALAMRASAAAARRRYDDAEALDRSLIRRAMLDEMEESSAARLDAAMAAARQIDGAEAEQERVAERAAFAADQEQSRRLWQEQRDVAERIGRIEQHARVAGVSAAGSDWRRRAIATIQQVQEQLVRLPQDLATGQEAAMSYRQAILREEAARREWLASEGDGRLATERALEQTRMAKHDVADRLEVAMAPISAELADRMAGELHPLEPEAAEARELIANQLQPALQLLQQAVWTGDRAEVERASIRTLAATELAQAALRDAQARLIQQDPLVAARWFAEAASLALAERPPDVKRARTHQDTVSAALRRAWQSAIREAASERLAITPGFRTVLRPPTPTADGGLFPLLATEVLPSLRQWGFPRQRQTDTLGAPLHESDPPVYQEALRVYFEALGKAQGDGARR